MKIKRQKNDAGEFRCFTISNTFLTRRGVARRLMKCSGVQVTKKPSIFGGGDDAFCEFEYKNLKFSILEPFGDNTEYWITCEKPDSEEFEEIGKYFETQPIEILSVFLWLLLIIPICYMLYDVLE